MKKKLLKSIFCIYFLTISCFLYSQTGGVSINSTNTPADPSAILDVSSTSAPYLGVLIPRMTTAARNSIIAPAVGLHVYNVDCGITEYYTGTCWVSTGQNIKAPTHITCSGTTDFCAGESRTFTISAVTGATYYEWAVPPGANITLGQGTTSIIVVFGNRTGDVCVTAENACETSQPRCLSLYINPVPAAPGNITGSTSVKPGTSVSYFIASIAGAGAYNWTLPSGATIASGAGTSNITVSFACNAVSGNVIVTAQGSCGTSPASSLAITVTPVSANAGPGITSPTGTLGGSPTASGGGTPYTYLWVPSTNLSSTTVSNPTAIVCATTTYTVTVTDANGCTSSSSAIASFSGTIVHGSQTFNATASGAGGSMQAFTVPSCITSITISASGAGGGQGTNYTQYTPGKGAQMQGTFAVTQGQVLKILVGQKGGYGTHDGGGGGGTYVTDNSNNPLIVAGGGGGSSYNGSAVDASTTTTGTPGATGGSGGVNGAGGVSGGYAGAGGGFTGNGGNGPGGSSTCNGGLSYLNGGTGGCFSSTFTCTGGYGGGGGSHGSGWGGGGGGGYSGGGASTSSQYGGGGGGSYNGGTNQTNTASVQTGDGQVVISW